MSIQVKGERETEMFYETVLRWLSKEPKRTSPLPVRVCVSAHCSVIGLHNTDECEWLKEEARKEGHYPQ